MMMRGAQCLGLASLLLLENYVDFLGGGGNARMHLPSSVTGLVLANALDILLLGGLIFVCLEALARTRFRGVMPFLLVLLTPLYSLGRVRSLLPVTLSHATTLWLTIAWPVVFLAVFFASRKVYDVSMLFLGRLAGAFALFAVASIGQLVVLAAWHPAPHERVAGWAAAGQTARQHPVLVWVVFDELSYDQVFDHRAPGLALPHFDELRSGSTAYSDVRPIGLHTVTILPSLISGRLVDDYRYRWDNSLDLHFSGVRGWHATAEDGSIFKQAQEAGWRTAAVGWYNPYCSAYGSAIDECYWMNHDMLEGPMAQSASFSQNVMTPLEAIGSRIVTPHRAEDALCGFDVRQRLSTQLDLEQHALEVLRSDQADLIFLHLPIPHSPGIWNRKTAAYATGCGSSYLDNLALTDLELGRILAILQASPRWQETTMVVEGDHSWRVPLWQSLHAWTKEDDAASKDVFDQRPALLVHEAHQSQPRTEAEPFSLLKVHGILQQALRAGS